MALPGNDSAGRRGLLLALVLVAVVAGAGALAIAVDSDDEPEKPAEPARQISDIRTTPAPAARPVPERHERPQRRRSRPRSFDATDESVRDVFEEQQSETVSQGPERTASRVISSRCESGRCTIRYNASQRGRGRLIRDALAILGVLFADRDLRQVVLIAHHETVGRYKDERLPILELRCTRDDYEAAVRGGDLFSLCGGLKRTGQHREAPHAGRRGGRR